MQRMYRTDPRKHRNLRIRTEEQSGENGGDNRSRFNRRAGSGNDTDTVALKFLPLSQHPEGFWSSHTEVKTTGKTSVVNKGIL